MQTTDKILQAAYHCFIHFGYSATSIVMIGKYADLSRFTVHKYYKNKEELFRAVVIAYGEEANEKSLKIMASQTEVWLKIKQVMQLWFEPIFQAIKDPIVYEDLMQASDKMLADVLEDHKHVLRTMFTQALQQAEQDNDISFDKISFNAEQMAEFLVISIHGIKRAIDVKKMPNYIEQLIQIHQIATQKL